MAYATTTFLCGNKKIRARGWLSSPLLRYIYIYITIYIYICILQWYIYIHIHILSIVITIHMTNLMFPEDDPYLVMEPLDGLRFFTPVGLAPGLDPLGEGVPAFFDLGFGFVEVGPTHKIPQRADFTWFYVFFANFVIPCYSPPVRRGLLDFIVSWPASASSSSSTGPAGPEQQPLDQSDPCRTSTASSRSQCLPVCLSACKPASLPACLLACLLACLRSDALACMLACFLFFLLLLTSFNYLAFALAFVVFCCCFFRVLVAASPLVRKLWGHLLVASGTIKTRKSQSGKDVYRTLGGRSVGDYISYLMHEFRATRLSQKAFSSVLHFWQSCFKHIKRSVFSIRLPDWRLSVCVGPGMPRGCWKLDEIMHYFIQLNVRDNCAKRFGKDCRANLGCARHCRCEGPCGVSVALSASVDRSAGLRQRKCQYRCHKGCQIGCQKRCQIECKNRMSDRMPE